MAKSEEANASPIQVGDIVLFNTLEKVIPGKPEETITEIPEPTEENPEPKPIETVIPGTPDQRVPSKQVPALVTVVHSLSCVNLRIFASCQDESDRFATSVSKGTAPGTFETR